jgi:hypothetical protein
MNTKIVKDNSLVISKVEEILLTAYQSNHAFNEAFNTDIPLQISSLIKDREPYNVDISEIIFWTDRNAYFDEVENWNNGKIEEENKETVDFLKITDKITIFSELVLSIKRKKIAPFIGAGLCAPLNFPSWGNALNEIVKRLEDMDLVDVVTLISEFKFLEAAEILLQKDDTQFINYISEKFSIRRDWGKDEIVVSALKLLPEIASGCVITTNYDKVLEKVFEFSNKPFEGFMHGIQQRNTFVTDLIRGDRCILKLHGNVGEKETYILSKSQYDAAYGEIVDFTKPLPKTLRQIFISHSMLFLGCSLEQDRTLDLFKQIKDEGQFEIPDHFAILSKPATAEKKRVKENRLSKMNIKAIWYPAGKHDFVEKILKLAIDAANNRIKI